MCYVMWAPFYQVVERAYAWTPLSLPKPQIMFFLNFTHSHFVPCRGFPCPSTPSDGGAVAVGENPNPKVVVDDEKSPRRRSIPDANKLGQWLETWHASTAKSRRREEETLSPLYSFHFWTLRRHPSFLSSTLYFSPHSIYVTFCLVSSSSLSLSHRMLLDFITTAA